MQYHHQFIHIEDKEIKKGKEEVNLIGMIRKMQSQAAKFVLRRP